jgi:hypothetical protein
MGDYIWFWAHKKLAKDNFYHLNILYNQEFDYVDWETIYEKLCNVPKLFQLWTCKQVMGAAGTIEWDKSLVQKCPSCMIEWNMCAHMLHYCHQGRVEDGDL